MFKKIIYGLGAFWILTLISPDDGGNDANVAPSNASPASLVEQKKSKSLPQQISAPPAQRPLTQLEKQVLFDKPQFVTGDRVNFRTGPDQSFDVGGYLTLGTRVMGGKGDGKWTPIRLNDGRQGWMASQFLSSTAPTVPASP